MKNISKAINILNAIPKQSEFYNWKSIVPIVGAGLICGIKLREGNVPSGSEYKEHMIAILSASDTFSDEEKEEIKTESFY